MTTFDSFASGAAIAFAVTGITVLAALLWHFRGVNLEDIRRVFRYGNQFIEVFRLMRGVKNAVVVFSSARIQAGSEAFERLRRISNKLAVRALELTGIPITIITGDGPGGMLAAHQGGHEGGARCVGLGIDLPHEKKNFAFANPYCQKRRLIKNFFPRKVGLIRWGDLAVVVGEMGVGTLEEMFEKATLAQCGHDNVVPIYLVEPAAAFDIHQMLMNMLRRGTISPSDIRMFALVDCPNVPDVTVDFVRKMDANRQPLPESQWCTTSVTMRRISEDQMVEEVCARMAAQVSPSVPQKLRPVQAKS